MSLHKCLYMNQHRHLVLDWSNKGGIKYLKKVNPLGFGAMRRYFTKVLVVNIMTWTVNKFLSNLSSFWWKKLLHHWLLKYYWTVRNKHIFHYSTPAAYIIRCLIPLLFSYSVHNKYNVQGTLVIKSRLLVFHLNYWISYGPKPAYQIPT